MQCRYDMATGLGPSVRDLARQSQNISHISHIPTLDVVGVVRHSSSTNSFHLKPSENTMNSNNHDDSTALHQHLVVPGQVILQESNDDENSYFLRGHGTVLQKNATTTTLTASVTGTIQRVNKLVSVEGSTRYAPQVGDLVVGRITQVGTTRWTVDLGSQTQASLPLSGVHLPGGVQRIRTAQDARDMRQFLTEGDLVSAEVHKVLSDNATVLLHTRSSRYGKLENGSVLAVSPSLVPRRKNHYYSGFLSQFDVLLGCNGMVWMQRQLQEEEQQTGSGQQELAQLVEEKRAEHARMPYSMEERQALARIRNVMACMKQASRPLTPESLEEVYRKSCVSFPNAEDMPDMLKPENVLPLAASSSHP